MHLICRLIWTQEGRWSEIIVFVTGSRYLNKRHQTLKQTFQKNTIKGIGGKRHYFFLALFMWSRLPCILFLPLFTSLRFHSHLLSLSALTSPLMSSGKSALNKLSPRLWYSSQRLWEQQGLFPTIYMVDIVTITINKKRRRVWLQEGVPLSVHSFLPHFLRQLQSILISLVKGQCRPPVFIIYCGDQYDKRWGESRGATLPFAL